MAAFNMRVEARLRFLEKENSNLIKKHVRVSKSIKRGGEIPMAYTTICRRLDVNGGSGVLLS